MSGSLALEGRRQGQVIDWARQYCGLNNVSVYPVDPDMFNPVPQFFAIITRHVRGLSREFISIDGARFGGYFTGHWWWKQYVVVGRGSHGGRPQIHAQTRMGYFVISWQNQVTTITKDGRRFNLPEGKYTDDLCNELGSCF
jgi:hypothetical protein